MRAMGEAALDLLVRFVDDLPSAPAGDTEPEALEARTRPRPGDPPTPLPDLLAEVFEGAGKGFNTAGPGYLGYIPGGGLFAAALADFVACGINRYVGVWSAAPRLVQLEQDVLRWLGQRFGYGEGARGVLTSGGSLANLTGIVT